MPIQSVAQAVRALSICCLFGCARPIAAPAVDTLALTEPAVGSPRLALTFDVRHTIAWLDATHLAVIDADTTQIVVLDLLGSIRRVGRRGKGPGEFTMPVDLLPLPDGGFLVLDIGPTGFHRFGANGAFLWSRGASGTPTWPVQLRGDTMFLSDQRWGGAPFRRVVVRVVGEGWDRTDLFHLDSIDPGLGPIEGENDPAPASVVGLPTGGSLLVNERAYRLYWLDATGRVVRSSGRPDVSFGPPSAEELASRREGIDMLERKYGEREMAERMRQDLERDAHRPRDPIDKVEVDDRGWVWVLTSRRDEGRRWFDLFSPDGSYRMTTSVSEEVWSFAVRDGELAILGPPAAGEEEVGAVIDRHRYDVLALKTDAPIR